MVISSNSLDAQFLGNYKNYTQSQTNNVKEHNNVGVTLELSSQSKALASQMNIASFGSVRLKASSSVMNVVLSNIQGTAS